MQYPKRDAAMNFMLPCFAVTVHRKYVPHRQKCGAWGVVIWMDSTMDHHDQSNATDFLLRAEKIKGSLMLQVQYNF